MVLTIIAGRLKQDGKNQDSKNVELMASPYVGGGFVQIQGKAQPSVLVMHFTSGGSARSSAKWFQAKDNPGSSAHVIIERDGSVIQCVNFKTVAWHAGKSRWKGKIGLNQYAIGIEMANWGSLIKTSSGWESYTGVAIPHPVLAVHKNGNPNGGKAKIGWEPFSQAQFDKAVEAARALIRAYPSITEIVGHDDIAKGRKWDPGPAFDMARFRELVMDNSAKPALV